ncbi:MAG: hypothetical protein ACO21V_07230, partial [Limnohabitans sp.]
SMWVSTTTSPGRAGRLDSYGMIGMRERAASVGATLEILSAPGQGTTVQLYLPLQAPSPATSREGS